MRQDRIRQLVETSLFAALIFLSVQSLRIPVGPQFIHFGNALVVVGVLLFGGKRGSLAAAIGLGIFDILNGYAAEVWITILEAVIVCVIVYFLYFKVLKSNDKIANIIVVALVAAVTKIILNLFKYTLTNILVGSLHFGPAISLAAIKIAGTFGSSLATLIAVPLLYPIFKKIFQNQVKRVEILE